MSTSGAKTVSSGSELPYFVWEVPGKISVHLYFDVIDRILPEVMRGFGALPRRGAEVGGILLGRVVEQDPLVVSVEEFEPLACQYLTGPSYHLSPHDLERLEELLGLWQDRPLQVVGYFRSHTRKDMYLDERDLNLVQRYFSSPNQVVLLIKPYATRASVGGFFFSEDGTIRAEAPYSQFPFHRRELGGGDPHPPLPRRELEPGPAQPLAISARPRPQPIPMPLPTPSTEARRPAPALQIERFPEDRLDRYEPSHSVPADASRDLVPMATRDVPFGASLDLPADSGRPGIGRWRIVAASLVAMVGLGAAYSWWEERVRTAGAVAAIAPLQLSVSSSGRQLDVTWNRQSPLVRSAQRGMLSISDGANRQEVELSAPQLQGGRVVYTRMTGEVNFRLDVFTNDRTAVSESTRVLVAEDTLPTGTAEDNAAQVIPETAAPEPVPSPASQAEPDPPEKEPVQATAANQGVAPASGVVQPEPVPQAAPTPPAKKSGVSSDESRRGSDDRRSSRRTRSAKARRPATSSATARPPATSPQAPSSQPAATATPPPTQPAAAAPPPADPPAAAETPREIARPQRRR